MAERRLVLHEDEGDDAKLEVLQKFLEGVEWDGENNGIIIWLNVTVGDTIVLTDEGAIRVERKPDDTSSGRQTFSGPAEG